MKRFAALFATLDQTTSTNAKVEALVRYFADAPADDAAWAVFFLTGRRLKRLLPWSVLAAIGVRLPGGIRRGHGVRRRSGTGIGRTRRCYARSGKPL